MKLSSAVGGAVSTAPNEYLTQLLVAAAAGDMQARRRFWESVHPELRRMAAAQLARDGAARHLQPTELVHELFLRWFGQAPFANSTRRYFYAAAAEALHCIIVDEVRRRRRLKRGGKHTQVPLERAEGVSGSGAGDNHGMVDQIALFEALEALKKVDPRKCEVVRLRVVLGWSVGETAQAMGLSSRTVESDFRFARAWLMRKLSG
jgi:RNA polymerase sigma factor (TIGR02999 family)